MCGICWPARKSDATSFTSYHVPLEAFSTGLTYQHERSMTVSLKAEKVDIDLTILSSLFHLRHVIRFKLYYISKLYTLAIDTDLHQFPFTFQEEHQALRRIVSEVEQPGGRNKELTTVNILIDCRRDSAVVLSRHALRSQGITVNIARRVHGSL